MGSLGVRLSLLALGACGVDSVPRVPEGAEESYRDVVELFDHGIARTCSLNNGVCHNSNNYPDLHTVTNLLSTLDRPCNVEVTERTQFADACEPIADRLVIPSASVDAAIVSAELLPAELALEDRELTRVTLVLDAAPALAPGATDTSVHRRDGTAFAVGARVVSVDGAQVVLDIDNALATQRFFDVRVFPPGSLRVHVGDPNGNGTQGALAAPMPLLAAGDPDGSYLFRRLVDQGLGELMPRQCRTWDDRANYALGCWISGLAPDLSNAYDPIDYASCTVNVVGQGKCADAE